MTGDMQGMLFGAISAAPDDAAEAGTAQRELRVCALNVNSAGPDRAQQLLEWMLSTKCNVLVLSEMKPGDGGRLLLTGLDAEGFRASCTTGWQASRHAAVVATRGFEVRPVDPAPFDPRVVSVDLAAEGTGKQPVRMVGVYAPTNGMTADSSLRRRAFQEQFLDYLTAISVPALCVAGDLNVIEPGHRPPVAGFEEHDYAFYTRLTELGLRDAYRSRNPEGGDHSWFSPRLGSQRLDHAMISRATGTIRECRYDHGPRARKLTDHAALLTTVSLGAST
jgi:exodeoxyribonuclease III